MLTGGCQCGALRYRVTGPTGRLFICHCDACRRQTGSAFDVALEVPRAAIVLTAGLARRSERVADSGRVAVTLFCADCGCHLWDEGQDDGAAIKVGSLDQRLDLSGAIHLYVGRKLPGIVIPDGAVQYDGEPD